MEKMKFTVEVQFNNSNSFESLIFHFVYAFSALEALTFVKNWIYEHKIVTDLEVCDYFRYHVVNDDLDCEYFYN